MLKSYCDDDAEENDSPRPNVENLGGPNVKEKRSKFQVKIRSIFFFFFQLFLNFKGTSAKFENGKIRNIPIFCANF